MKPSPDKNPSPRRRAAEAQWKKQTATRPLLPEADVRRLQHELEVHQIELEMQNDELLVAEEELQRQTEDLRVQNDVLTRFNGVAVGRELRMIELKCEINELCVRLEESPRYKIVDDSPPHRPLERISNEFVRHTAV